MKKLILFLLLCQPAMADYFRVTIDVDGVDTYTVDGSLMRGTTSQAKGMIYFEGSIDGEVMRTEQPLPNTEEVNSTTMQLVDKGRVRITESEYGVDVLTSAKLKKTLFGKVIGLKILADDYLNVINPVLEKAGLSILQQLDLEMQDFDLTTSLDTSDYTCEASGKIYLDCQFSAKFSMEVVAKD